MPSRSAAEEGIYALEPFGGKHDLPQSWAQAASRLHYIAMNMLRVDAGNEAFGHVAAVFSPAFWRDAVAAGPIDTGMYTMSCNETYRALPNSTNKSFPYVTCPGLDPSPGVYGHLDHVLLNNDRGFSTFLTNSTSPGGGQLGRLFSRWFGDSPRWTDVSALDTITYVEANILAHAHYSTRDIKCLIANFAHLFGTARGLLLQDTASRRGLALLWSLGSGFDTLDDQSKGLARRGFDQRLLDGATGPRPFTMDLLNMSVPKAERDAFREAWEAAASTRKRLAPTHNGTLSPKMVSELWATTVKSMPTARLFVPDLGACADWQRCLGVGVSRRSCVCYA